MAKLLLEKITWSNYKALETKNPETIYFISDRHCIQIRDTLYSSRCELVSSIPENPEVGVVYIDKTTLEAKKYTGDGWEILSKGFTTSIIDNNDSDLLPTAKAVADFVSKKMESVESAKNAYTGASTTTTTTTILDDSKISVDVKISATSGNSLSKKNDGLYVQVPDDTTKASKIGTGHTNEILIATSLGDMTGSGAVIGGSVIATIPNNKTVATELAVKKYADSVAESASKNVQTNVDKLTEKIGQVPNGKTVVQMISENQSSGDSYDDTQIKADISANANAIKQISDDYLKSSDLNVVSEDVAKNSNEINENKNAIQQIMNDYLKSSDLNTISTEITKNSNEINANKNAIDILNGTGDGSVFKQVADAVALLVSEAPEAYDTLREISDWISNHSNSASGMNTAIQTNTEEIAKLQVLLGKLPDNIASTTIVDYINEAINNSGFAKEVNLSEVSSKVASIEVIINNLGNLSTKNKVSTLDLEEDINNSLDLANTALQLSDINELESSVEQNKQNISDLESLVNSKTSVYEIALTQGYNGTIEEFATALINTIESQMSLGQFDTIVSWNDDETIYTITWTYNGSNYSEIMTIVSDVQYTKKLIIDNVEIGLWTTTENESTNTITTIFTAL